MTDNTVKTADGIEVYQHDIYYYADEYIKQELDGDADKLSKRFRDMILYISDRIPKPDHDDIVLLDKIFDIYVRLCSKYERLPTIECYCLLTKIHRSTLNDWGNGVYRSSDKRYADAQKRWLEVCKSFAIDELSNSKVANVNLIFVSKAAYGLRETSPIPAPATDNKPILTADCLPRLDGSSDWKPSESVNGLPRLENIENS